MFSCHEIWTGGMKWVKKTQPENRVINKKTLIENFNLTKETTSRISAVL